MSTLKLSFFKKQVLVLAFHVSTRYQVLPTSLARKPEKKKMFQASGVKLSRTMQKKIG